MDKKNDYGGSIGGPITIPDIYKGHNRIFGSFSLEQYRQGQSGVATSSVPTAAVRRSDLSS